MKSHPSLWILAGLCAGALLVPAHAQEPKAKPNPAVPDITKKKVELTAERLAALKAAMAAADADNPKVEPGKVQWHGSFAAACQAAADAAAILHLRQLAKSGKPVLLFQMMGKLDDRFC